MLDMFSKRKEHDPSKPSPMGMVMDFLTNPSKLKDSLMKQLYPAAEKSMLKYIDNVELQDGEVQAAIVLYKNKNTERLDYVLVTISDEDKIIRQIEVDNVQDKLEGMASKLKIF